MKGRVARIKESKLLSCLRRYSNRGWISYRNLYPGRVTTAFGWITGNTLTGFQDCVGHNIAGSEMMATWADVSLTQAQR